MSNFRFSATKLFLTYARPTTEHQSFTNQELICFLKEKTNSKYIISCKEKHQDGSDHFHALCYFQSRCNFKDPRKFDFNGWHPKWEAPRNIQATINYIKKDGDFLEEGEYVVEVDYTQRALQFDNKSEWMSFCVNNKITFPYANYFWQNAHPAPTATITDNPTAGTLNRALSHFTFDEWDTRSCVLVGPTGCGKTVWAKRNAPKPALMVSHLDQLKNFDPNIHKSIIFDDMVFKHYPIQSQIHLVDQYEARAIHCRYMCAIIPEKTPKIFTCNERPFDLHPAINRRIRLFNISEDTWGQENEPIEIN